MSEKSFILRIHLMIEITRILRQRLNHENSAAEIKITGILHQRSNLLRSHLCEHTGSGLLRAFGKLKSAGIKICSKHFRNLLIL